MLTLLMLISCKDTPGRYQLTESDQALVATVMDNNCRVPEDCTFGVELDGRAFISGRRDRPQVMPEHITIRLSQDSPFLERAGRFGCIALKGGGPSLVSNTDCSLTGIAEEMPYLRMTLTRRYVSGGTATMSWRVNVESNTLTPIMDET